MLSGVLCREGRDWRSVMADYDAIVIGTGQSGPALARRLVAAGWEVAVSERKFFGGTCVNTGCMPTKTLIASGLWRSSHAVPRNTVTIGGAISVDMKAGQGAKGRHRRCIAQGGRNDP
jgi:pyruvate/2-oxoglutarate dehydrogenase complex dihydrolipoamide dehydrogenase (E3) component